MALPIPKADPTPTTVNGSNDDELRASQARLYRLLLEAQERLKKERSSDGGPNSEESSEAGEIEAAR